MFVPVQTLNFLDMQFGQTMVRVGIRSDLGKSRHAFRTYQCPIIFLICNLDAPILLIIKFINIKLIYILSEALMDSISCTIVVFERIKKKNV